MADNKDKANQATTAPEVLAEDTAPVPTPVSTKTVDEVDQGSPVQLENAVENPDKQLAATGDLKVGPGENIYFFPDIQKSVVAKSQEEAQKQVQGELDQVNKEENK